MFGVCSLWHRLIKLTWPCVFSPSFTREVHSIGHPVDDVREHLCEHSKNATEKSRRVERFVSPSLYFAVADGFLTIAARLFNWFFDGFLLAFVVGRYRFAFGFGIGDIERFHFRLNRLFCCVRFTVDRIITHWKTNENDDERRFEMIIRSSTMKASWSSDNEQSRRAAGGEQWSQMSNRLEKSSVLYLPSDQTTKRWTFTRWDDDGSWRWHGYLNRRFMRLESLALLFSTGDEGRVDTRKMREREKEKPENTC